MKTAKNSELMRRIHRDLYQLRLALLLLFIYGVITQLVFHTICPFAILTGFACPACGMTRAVSLFFIGKFRLSLSLHPLALPWILLILYLGCHRYIGNRRAPFVWPLTIFLCLVTLAFYLFRFTAGTLPEVPCSGLLHLALSFFV